MSVEEVIERIKLATGAKTQGDIASILKIRRETISEAKRRGVVPAEWYMKLYRSHGINPPWLADGIGPKYAQDLTGPSAMVSHNAHKTTRDKKTGQVTIPQWPTPSQDFFDFVPMAEAHLSAGGGAFVLSEATKDFYAFRKDWLRRIVSSPKNAVLMTVQGDSMFDTIQDGDVVLLDTGRCHVYDGNIYALRLDSTIVIKRLSLLPGNKILVISDNKEEYPPYEANALDVHVLGKIVWFARSLVKNE